MEIVVRVGLGTVAIALLWSAIQGLSVWLSDRSNVPRRENRVPAFILAFTALTGGVVLIGGVSWRMWGTPGDSLVVTGGLSSGWWCLVAVWLVSAARLVLLRKSARMIIILDLSAATLLAALALRVQWLLPFE